MIRRSLAVAALLAALTVLPGCGGYTLTGRVVQSQFSMITFVPDGDQRLGGAGVPSVTIKVYRDPDRPNTEMVARGTTDANGNFSIPIGAFGAGWMVEQWRITATRAGYESGDVTLTLPGSSDGQRLLVNLTPGYTPPTRDDDLMKQYEKYR